MKSFVTILLGVVLLAGTLPPAYANACAARAQAEASRYPGARVITAQAVSNAKGQRACRIAIKLPPRNNQPGRVITRVVRP